jgi:hypothetical protein
MKTLAPYTFKRLFWEMFQDDIGRLSFYRSEHFENEESTLLYKDLVF